MKITINATYLILSLLKLPTVFSFVGIQSRNIQGLLSIRKTQHGNELIFDFNGIKCNNQRTIGRGLNVAAVDTLMETEERLKTEDEKSITYVLQDPVITITSVPEVPKIKSFKDDGFVFGLEGSGLVRAKGKVSNVVVESDSLETTPYQVALVSTTLISHGLFAAYSIAEVFASSPGTELVATTKIIATVFLGWVFADLGSGILHWSVDNYGNGRTPIMGNIIAAFQGHHSAPWTITERGFCNNVHKLCTPFGIPTMILIAAISGPLITLFFSIFCTLEIMSQEFHKWSHMPKKEATSMVNRLLKSGLVIGRVPHSQHHTAPFEGRYCIVSGFCNNFLDGTGFFRMLEHLVYKINGVEANSWKLDEKLKVKTLKGQYKLNRKLR